MLLAAEKAACIRQKEKGKKKNPSAQTVWVSDIDLLNVSGMFSGISNFAR